MKVWALSAEATDCGLAGCAIGASNIVDIINKVRPLSLPALRGPVNRVQRLSIIRAQTLERFKVRA